MEKSDEIVDQITDLMLKNEPNIFLNIINQYKKSIKYEKE
jgi:hypothetical protein